MRRERTVVVTILAAIILAAICYLPVMAAGNSTGGTTITMNTTSVLAISLSQTGWKPNGEEAVSMNTTYKTELPANWCTITNTGNANVTIRIKGDDAKWVTDPEYKWTLSGTGANVKNMYALWYHISGDTEDSYSLITKTETAMEWTKDGKGILNLRKHGNTKQFGLKLLTPTYFIGGRTMQTTIIIGAVAA